MSKELTNYFLSVGLIVTGTFFCIGTHFLQWGSRRKFTSFPALVGFVFVGYFGHLTTWYLAGFAFMVCLLFFLILMDVSNIMFLQMLFRFYPNLRGRAKGGGFGAVGDDYDFEHGIVGMVLLLPISIILYLLIRNWARGPFSELLYGSVTICALALLVRKLGMSMDTIIKRIGVFT
jgi:hypothetical protein